MDNTTVIYILHKSRGQGKEAASRVFNVKHYCSVLLGALVECKLVAKGNPIGQNRSSPWSR